MTGVGQSQAHRGRLGAQDPAEQGAEELGVAVVTQQDLVGDAQQPARLAHVEGGTAEGVADGPGDYRCLGPAPTHVAQGKDPGAAAGTEEVVEVAAHLHAGPEGDVAGGRLHAGDDRQ